MSDIVDKKLKVISLVPSWTETLLECGVNVVGRTRFCIHPSDIIEDIPAVGGTKDINWDKVKSSDADIVIMDKEENPKEFADECPLPFIATHVDSIESVSTSLLMLSEKLGNQKLFNLAGRWQAIAAHEALAVKDLNKFPGLIQWVQKPRQKIQKIYYMIWKNPWMTVSRETFIGSVLMKLGIEKYLDTHNEKYPEIDLRELDSNSTLLMFSSEPYPFQKKIEELTELGFPSLIINGECFSWFGIRSLIFLEIQIELFKPKKPVFNINQKT
jgi:ABC-type Fe3+-hydroxamate transport system substrate-binding protein